MLSLVSGAFNHGQALSASTTSSTHNSVLVVISTLVLFDLVMSIDNALIIAAITSHLRGMRRLQASLAGFAGAVALRVLALFAIHVLETVSVIGVLGSIYLIYAMCNELGSARGSVVEQGTVGVEIGFWRTVVRTWLADASCSADNVIVLVSVTSSMVMLVGGVLIGILLMFLAAALCVPIIKRHPVLRSAAFLLMGFAGLRSLAQYILAVQFSVSLTVVCIGVIVASCLAYEKWCQPDGRMSSLIAELQIAMAFTAELIVSPFALINRWFDRPRRSLLRLIDKAIRLMRRDEK